MMDSNSLIISLAHTTSHGIGTTMLWNLLSQCTKIFSILVLHFAHGILTNPNTNLAINQLERHIYNYFV